MTPEHLFLWFFAFALVGGVSFIVGAHIGEGRGRRQARREFETRWAAHLESFKQRWVNSDGVIDPGESPEFVRTP